MGETTRSRLIKPGLIALAHPARSVQQRRHRRRGRGEKQVHPGVRDPPRATAQSERVASAPRAPGASAAAAGEDASELLGDDAPNPLRPVEVPRRDVGAEDVRADEHAPLDLGAETAGSSRRGGLVKTLSSPRGDENPLSTRFEPRCLTSSQFAVSRGTVPTVYRPVPAVPDPVVPRQVTGRLRGGQDVVRGERGGGARQRHGRHRRAQPLQQLARLAPRGSDLV
mmetsp:Transcript_11011/g.42864  ORF Transcript_11011/g.42864 Transcript_11011/m.42864 type:complete len:225 (-) Transcript_11011:982-1656(-)